MATYKLVIVPTVPAEKEVTVEANNAVEAIEAAKVQLLEGDVIKAVNPV